MQRTLGLWPLLCTTKWLYYDDDDDDNDDDDDDDGGGGGGGSGHDYNDKMMIMKIGYEWQQWW